jgi:hypothetical protein
MRGIRGHLTFANVVSMIALFVALGGGAYALSRGEVKSRNIAKDAVKARHIAFGVRSQPMLANFSQLEAEAVGSTNYAPVGDSGSADGLVHEARTPQTFFATGLRIRLDGPLATGTREFIIAYWPGQGPNQYTNVRCEVAAGEQTCASNGRVRIPGGSSIWVREEHNNTTEVDYAEAGWRAVLP